MPELRILIYARGTPAEIIDQHAKCYAAADNLGEHQVVSLASDTPDGSDGWESANAMLAAGEVDRILVATRDVIPIMEAVDSVTRGIQPLRAGPIGAATTDGQEPSWQRRPRRLRGFRRPG